MLATSKFGQEIQGEVDLYITNDRLNEASFRRKLEPISRNMIKNQNSQNPVIGSLIRELDIGKKKGLE